MIHGYVDRVYFFYRVVDSHSKVHLHFPRLWGEGEVGSLGEEGHLEEQQQSSQQRSIETAFGHRQPHRLLPRTGSFFLMYISSNSGNILTNYRHALDMFRWWSRLQSQPVWNPLNSFTWDRLTPSTGLWVILRIFSGLLVSLPRFTFIS